MTAAALAAVPIYLKTVAGETITMDFDASATITDILATILVREGIPADRLKLFLRSKRTYGDGSGTIIAMDVEVSETIDAAVSRLHDELDIEPCHQLWVFEEQALQPQLPGTAAIAS